MRKLSLFLLPLAGLLFFAARSADRLFVLSPGPIGPYLDGVFTAAAPGEGGRWAVEDVFPDIWFQGPVRVVPFPEAGRGVVILGKRGRAWLADPVSQASREILDLTDRVQNGWEGGSLGIAFHPDFRRGTPEVFVYYRWREDNSEFSDGPAYQRLSRFQWDAAADRVDEASEEVLIQQYDRRSWHAGGDMFFGPEGYLYLSLGDEGTDGDPAESNQRLDAGLFGGVIRIDVDNDPNRSHPIRRLPFPPGTAPASAPPTYTRGYMIPNDNPWLDPTGGSLEEFVVMGTRSPHVMSWDSLTQTIWITDVGASNFEEINRARVGDNLQWPWREGNRETGIFARPDAPIGRETPPYLAYPHEVGASVMGGGVYRGERFPSLFGKFIFADWVANTVMAVDAATEAPALVTLIPNLNALLTEMPGGGKVSGVYPQAGGDIYLSVMGSRGGDGTPGKIYRLAQRDAAPEPPALLSQTGAFTDLETLTPAPGVLPYRTNAQLYSDGAIKKRWLAVPNDGSYDAADEQIEFSARDNWTFPGGTVFIKHFEMPVSTTDPARTTRLETRFFVVGENGVGYGLTYRWNDEGTDAYLLANGDERDYEVLDEQDRVVETGTWSFPSRVQCLTCHTDNSGYVLGVRTHQLNGELTYPHDGGTYNQLEYLAALGVLRGTVPDVTTLPKAYPLDDESVSLDLRVRSYLDANCASCHQPGGQAHIDMDLRFQTEDERLRRVIGEPTKSHASSRRLNLVEPGDHRRSELWLRDASELANQMPPIGRSRADALWVDRLAEWIDGLPTATTTQEEFAVYPNPTDGPLRVFMGTDWTPPYQISVYDSAGRRVSAQSGREETVRLTLDTQPRGVYVITATDGTGNRSSRRVIRR